MPYVIPEKLNCKVRVNDTNTYDVVDELKALYCKSELWNMSIWTGFLSTLMEGNTCLERHLENVYDTWTPRVQLGLLKDW